MPEIKKYKITEPWLHTKCGLGEAPFHESSTNTLRFVDIVHAKLHRASLPHGPSSLTTIDLPHNIGTTADIQNNNKEIVFGGKYGYGLMDRGSGETRWIAKFWDDEARQEDGGGKPGRGRTLEERCRANDGAVDARGRFFVGVMNDPVVVGGGNFTDEGGLYRLDQELSIRKVKDKVTIPNGLSWSDDNKFVFFTDSPSGKIVKHPYDLETGEIDWTKREDFFTCPYSGGVPDGHAQDTEGCFWIACFGTSKVVRVDAQGQVIAEVECPTRCVTCPAFCGTELVITSAAEEEPERYPWSVEFGGAVFKVDVGVGAKAKNEFRMEAKA